jgi:hypothetical protein
LLSNPPSCAKLGAVVSPTTVRKQPVLLNSQSRVRIQTKRYNRTKQNRIEQKREREREREREIGTASPGFESRQRGTTEQNKIE